MILKEPCIMYEGVVDRLDDHESRLRNIEITINKEIPMLVKQMKSLVWWIRTLVAGIVVGVVVAIASAIVGRVI